MQKILNDNREAASNVRGRAVSLRQTPHPFHDEDNRRRSKPPEHIVPNVGAGDGDGVDPADVTCSKHGKENRV